MTARRILITGSTDGIGLRASRRLAAGGNRVLVHGRSPARVEGVVRTLEEAGGEVAGLVADLSHPQEAAALARRVVTEQGGVDVLVNNAGVFLTARPRTPEGLDRRFAVNTIAPWLITRELLPHLPADGRVVNVASAAQRPVDLEALAGRRPLADDFEAYAQSKLALIMWTNHLAALRGREPILLSVNPGSLLDTRMVREAFGRARRSAEEGARVLEQAALDAAFARPGAYFDGDRGRFAPPHRDALDPVRCARVAETIEVLRERLGIPARP